MGNELSRKMLYRLKGEKSAFCQIFGHEPEVMSDSVKIDEVAAFDGVDINMGCPVRKIVKAEMVPLCSKTLRLRLNVLRP